MGCIRNALIEKPNVAIDATVVEVCNIPGGATEGQMSFYNRGATNIAIRLAQQRGSKDVTIVSFTLMLQAGDAYTEEGIVPGVVIAISSAAGGILDTYISYRG